MLQVDKGIGTSQVEVYEKVGKSIIPVFKRAIELKYLEKIHLGAVSFNLLSSTSLTSFQGLRKEIVIMFSSRRVKVEVPFFLIEGTRKGNLFF